MNASILIFGQDLSVLELLGAISGVLGIWLTARKSIHCFPVGLLNVIIYAWIFFSPDVRLYADGILQLAFGVLLAYGWKNWTSTGIIAELKVTSLTKKDIHRLFLISIPAAFLLGEILLKCTDAALPRLDASLAVCSLVAQWLVARKKLENWLLWIVVNVVYIPVYWHRSLPITAALYFIYLLLAIKGLRDWRTSVSNQTAR